jgi:hypothetical protein
MSILVLKMLFIACLGLQPTQAQQSLESGAVLPMGEWLEFKQVTFTGSPILLHLRTGYERAVLFPESVRLENSNRKLPGCEIFLDNEIVGFYPTLNFKGEIVRLVGSETGDVYELHVRSSTVGIRQPLQIKP